MKGLALNNKKVISLYWPSRFKIHGNAISLSGTTAGVFAGSKRGQRIFCWTALGSKTYADGSGKRYAMCSIAGPACGGMLTVSNSRAIRAANKQRSQLQAIPHPDMHGQSFLLRVSEPNFEEFCTVQYSASRNWCHHFHS